jgi:hypothetical protein
MKHLFLCLALVAGSAQAEFYTGNELLQRLNSESLGERAAGIGYIMGVADSGHGVIYCPPEHVTSGQLRDMVRNYLTNTPAVRHLSADSLVTHVIKSQWPCAARTPGRQL